MTRERVKSEGFGPREGRVRIYTRGLHGAIYASYRDARIGKTLRLSLGHRDWNAARTWAAEQVRAITAVPARPREEMVYVIQRGGRDGPVKIGVTSNLEHRLKVFRTSTPEPLEVVATYRLRDLEQLLHDRLRAHHLQGEWFSVEALKHLPTLWPRLPEGAAQAAP